MSVFTKRRVLCAGDRTSWVEVYVQSKRQWKSVHLPSLSVGQPQLCEKHCSQPLHYIIGIENGTHAGTCIHVHMTSFSNHDNSSPSLYYNVNELAHFAQVVTLN